MTRPDAIATIRAGLNRRSPIRWSVRGGRGTAWGWIYIEAPPSRRVDGCMTREDAAELARLLGLDDVHHQGVSVPSSDAYYAEYIDRANGVTPSRVGVPYWD